MRGTRILCACALGFALAAAACTPPSFEEEEQILFPEREDDRKDGDQELKPGEKAENLAGWDGVMNAAVFVQELTPTEKEGYLVIDVTMTNTAGRERRARRFDWRLETPSGKELNHTFVQGWDGQLPATSQLEQDKSVTGKVVFRVRDEKGTFWIYYIPGGIDDAKGIWKLVV